MTAKERYASMTKEQREARKAYQRDYMRQRRSKQKLAKAPAIPPAASVPAPAPQTSDKPQNAPLTKPARTSKPKSDRAQRRVWRSGVVDFLTDCLTDPACPMTGEWYEKHRMGSMWLGFYDRLNQIESTVDDRPDVLAELRLSIAIECLRRLTGETPAGKAPALPGTAQKPAYESDSAF
jgi:hypothetical protein